MMIAPGWLCQCCMSMWAPFVGTCPVCSMTGQMNDELRAFHDCPTWGPIVDNYFLSLETAPSPAPAYRVTPRPHIETTGAFARITVITPCLSCEMPLDRCESIRGGQRCCDACDHFGVAKEPRRS